MSEDRLINRLHNAKTVRDTAVKQIEAIVSEARRDGTPWRVIACGLGLSVHATWHKYHHLDEALETK